VRVLVWNLFHGRAVPGARRDLFRHFAGRIAEWEWELALLQEVPPWWPSELASSVEAEERAALTSRNGALPLRRALAVRWPDVIKSNGGGSNAILARGSIADHSSVRLRRFPERRVMQLARLGDGSCVANLHLSTIERLAREELSRALELALDWASDSALLFGGDLNLQDPDAPGLEHAAASHVDHVFVRGFDRVGEPVIPDQRLGPAALSDHRPLIVEVAPRSPQTSPSGPVSTPAP
jgi:endonuclease/exonuclease/phosphatase family metal-dependent hydrolase